MRSFRSLSSWSFSELSKFVFQRITFEWHALSEAAGIGIDDFSGEQSTVICPTRKPVSPYWNDPMVARDGRQ